MSEPRNLTAADAADQLVHITRFIRAPRELVYKAWTDPEQLPRWHAPHGCTIRYRQIDVREGGLFHSCISNPQFGDCWVLGVYHEVSPPERIVYSMTLADEHGKPDWGAAGQKDPEWPAETTVTVTFAEQDGGTLVTLQQSVLESVAKRTGAYPSWLQMLDRMEEVAAWAEA